MVWVYFCFGSTPHNCRHNDDDDAANDDSSADHCGAQIDIGGDHSSSVICGMRLVQCVLG